MKIILYILCSIAILFIVICLNAVCYTEGGVTVGLGDVIFRNIGLFYILDSLGKYILDDLIRSERDEV